MSIKGPAVGLPCCPPLTDEPLVTAEARDLSRMFKALGDPVRLRILSLIASHEGGLCCVCDITEAFEVSQPTVSHHLKTLRAAGLLDCERRGTWVYYWVIPSALRQLSTILNPGSDIPDTPDRASTAAVQRRVCR